ncbi:hypothetical protein LguiA_009097 [Lonicera macranthoides]
MSGSGFFRLARGVVIFKTYYYNPIKANATIEMVNPILENAKNPRKHKVKEALSFKVTPIGNALTNVCILLIKSPLF